MPLTSIDLGLITFDIHEKPGISCSGGADSSILLYLLMKYSKDPIHVYSLASKQKFRSVGAISHSIISKCMELTGKSEVYHSVFYTDVQTNHGLFKQAQKDFADNKIKILYTGLTLVPPDEVLKEFINPVDMFVNLDRRTNILHNVYKGVFYTPFVNLNKKHIKELYVAEGVLESLFPLTRSCESLDQPFGHCGCCWWCEERNWAFGRLE